MNSVGRIRQERRYFVSRYFILSILVLFLFCHCDCMNGEWGFIDKNGNVVVDFRYDEVKSYSGGVAVVYKDGKAGLVDYNGKEILKPAFSDIYDFVGKYGYFVIRKEVDGRIDESYGFLENSGKVVVEPVYGYVKFIYSDIAAVRNKNGSKYFLLKIGENKKITDEIFDDINNFSEDRAAFKSNEKYGVVDVSGRIIVEPKYNDIRDYKDGYAIARTNKKDGVLDKEGNVLLDFIYDEIVGIEKDYITFKSDVKYGIMNIRDKSVFIEPKYNMLSVVKDSFAVFCNGSCTKCDEQICSIDSRFTDFGREIYIGDEVGYVSLKGEITVFNDINIASVFSQKRAVVCNWKDRYSSASCYLIDENLKRVGSDNYEVIKDFYNERAVVCNDCRYGYGDFYFIDLSGSRINNEPFIQAKNFSEGLAAVVRDQPGLTDWNFIDTNGRIVIDDEYNIAFSFKEGRAAVCKGLCERLGGGH